MAKAISFLGFRFIAITDDVVRKTTAYCNDGMGHYAINQTNGFIAVYGLRLSGKIGTPLSTYQRERLAFFLYRFGLISREIWEEHHKRHDIDAHNKRVASCAYDAEQLGYRLVKLKPAKKVPE